MLHEKHVIFYLKRCIEKNLLPKTPSDLKTSIFEDQNTQIAKNRFNGPPPYGILGFVKKKRNKSSWWLNQPIWKLCSSKLESFPNFRGEHKKYLSWHHVSKCKKFTNGRHSGRLAFVSALCFSGVSFSLLDLPFLNSDTKFSSTMTLTYNPTTELTASPAKKWIVGWKIIYIFFLWGVGLFSETVLVSWEGGNGTQHYHYALEQTTAIAVNSRPSKLYLRPTWHFKSDWNMSI